LISAFGPKVLVKGDHAIAAVRLPPRSQDPPRLVAEGETLKQRLCNSATHCPHTTVLGYRESLASVFEDASGGGLAQPTLELVREIEARGLP
jgi:hypothetical protein